jgi:hypothetical protein
MEDINPKVEIEIEEQDSLTENQRKILTKALNKRTSGWVIL